MKRIQNFRTFNSVNEANLFSKGVEIARKAGNWLMNLVKAQDKNEIPVRDKKYNPESESFDDKSSPEPFIKIHLIFLSFVTALLYIQSSNIKKARGSIVDDPCFSSSFFLSLVIFI